MTNARHNTPTLDQLALRWIKALPKGGPNVRQAFAQFVRTSPEHLRVYLTHKALDVELKALDPQRQIDVAQYIARARKRGNVIPWDGNECDPLRITEHERSAGFKRPVVIGGILFALAISSLVLGALMVQWHSTSRNIYITDVGQRRHIQLPDGSQLELNTRSTVAVNFTPTQREVRLVDGEALFTVHHDGRKPFRVRVGTELIEDIGTVFNVRVSGVGTRVSVAEGRVDLVSTTEVLERLGGPRGVGFARRSVADRSSALVLQQYDEALLSSDPRIGKPRVTRLSGEEMTNRVSWTQGVVTFNGQTLLEAVEEINRYNRVRLEVVDPHITGMRLGGTFNPTDLRSFVTVLERFGVKSDAAAVVGRGFGTIHLFGSMTSPSRTSRPVQ